MTRSGGDMSFSKNDQRRVLLRGCHDAAVWMLDPWWLNGKSTGIEEVVLPGDPEILPRDKRRVDPWLPKRFEKGRRRRMPSRPAAIYPGHIIRRIGAQRSCFTIHGTDPYGLDKIAAGYPVRGFTV
jgi:hypothetical protein